MTRVDVGDLSRIVLAPLSLVLSGYVIRCPDNTLAMCIIARPTDLSSGIFRPDAAFVRLVRSA